MKRRWPKLLRKHLKNLFCFFVQNQILLFLLNIRVISFGLHLRNLPKQFFLILNMSKLSRLSNTSFPYRIWSDLVGSSILYRGRILMYKKSNIILFFVRMFAFPLKAHFVPKMWAVLLFRLGFNPAMDAGFWHIKETK